VQYRYPWPASALTRRDMQALHAVREAAPQKTPITELIAEAVRDKYANTVGLAISTSTESIKKEAA